MKFTLRIIGIAIIAFIMLLCVRCAFSQSSGPTVPPPPYCASSNAGEIYTYTGTSPKTVYTCSYYNLAWQWVVNPSYGGFVYYPTIPSTCSGSLPVFLGGWPNTKMYVCVAGVPAVVAGYGSGVTSFTAPPGSWPSWLIPSVTGPDTNPVLNVSATDIPISNGGTGATTAGGALTNLGAAAANASTTVNGQNCALGSTCTVTAVPSSPINLAASGAGGVTGTLSTGNGGTGATTAPGALSNLTGGVISVDTSAAGTTTSGIQEAINSFPGTSCGEIILPKGVLPISTTITVNSRYGCKIHGQGEGYTAATATTVLQWTGVSGGTVFQVKSTAGSSFDHFMIDGGATVASPSTGAGIGLDITAHNANGVTVMDDFFQIHVKNTIAGTGYEAVHVGSSGSDEIDNAHLYDMIIDAPVNGVGVLQDGGQTTNSTIKDSIIEGAYQYGVNYRAGQANLQNVNFERFHGGTTLADVNISNIVGTATFLDNSFEVRDAMYGTGNAGVGNPAYNFESGQRYAPTTIIGDSILWLDASGNIINDLQVTPLTIQGVQFMNNGPGPVGVVNIAVPSGGGQPSITILNNEYASGNTLSVSGNMAVRSNNDSSLIGSLVGDELYRYGEFFKGGSLNFGLLTSTTPDYTLYEYVSTHLLLKNGSITLQDIDTSGNEVLLGKLQVGGDAHVLGSVAATNVAASGTVSGSTLATDIGGIGTTSNLVLYSEFPPSSIGSTWVSAYSPTITSNAVANPLTGAITAETITSASTIPLGWTGQLQYGTVTAGLPYAVSVYVQGVAGGEKFIFGVDNVTGFQSATLTTPDKNWHRYIYLIPSLPSSGWNGRIFFIGLQTVSASINVWGAQVQQLASCSFPIMTTGSANTGVTGLFVNGAQITGSTTVASTVAGALPVTSYATTFATLGAYFSSANVTLSHLSTTTVTLSGVVPNAQIALTAIQDSTGGNTITLAGCPAGSFYWDTGSGLVATASPPLTPAANGQNFLAVTYDGSNCVVR